MEIKIKRKIAILLAICILIPALATTVTAKNYRIKSSFTADVTSGPFPLDVTFTDNSESDSGITSWYWEFGDGATSTDPAPTHTYNEPGKYTVKLTVTSGDGGSTTYQKKKYITVEGLSCDFTTTNSPSGSAPYVVRFKPEVSSDSKITSWDWDFGDGSPHFYGKIPPGHKYTTPNSYTVSLSVTDAAGNTGNEVKPDFITVT